MATAGCSASATAPRVGGGQEGWGVVGWRWGAADWQHLQWGVWGVWGVWGAHGRAEGVGRPGGQRAWLGPCWAGCVCCCCCCCCTQLVNCLSLRPRGGRAAGEHWDATEQMDTYYNPVPHFGYDLALAHSPQLREVPALPRDAGLGGGLAALA